MCYERLGCFTDDPPWSGIPGRELTGLPSPPEAVNTNFLLYTRDNTMKYQVSNWFALNIDSVLHGQQIIWTALFLPAEAPIHITHATSSPSQFPFISFLFPHVSCLMGQVELQRLTNLQSSNTSHQRRFCIYSMFFSTISKWPKFSFSFIITKTEVRQVQKESSVLDSVYLQLKNIGTNILYYMNLGHSSYMIMGSF